MVYFEPDRTADGRKQCGFNPCSNGWCTSRLWKAVFTLQVLAVSILVLMDGVLRAPPLRLRDLRLKVSILVLMDGVLRDRTREKDPPQDSGFQSLF